MTKAFAGLKRLHESLWVEKEPENRCGGEEVCHSTVVRKQTEVRVRGKQTHSKREKEIGSSSACHHRRGRRLVSNLGVFIPMRQSFPFSRVRSSRGAASGSRNSSLADWSRYSHFRFLSRHLPQTG